MASPPSRQPDCSDMGPLLATLGGKQFALPGAGDDTGGSRQIGTLGDLPFWTLSGRAAEIREVARRLAKNGRLGVIGANDATTGRWYFAATVLPVHLTVTVAGDVQALPLRRLARAAHIARPTSLEHAIALAEALDVDAAGRKTFRLLHALLERAVTELPARVSRDDRHAWALAQITRLLFLRFVESEGWLDGNPRFLAEAFDRCLRARRDPTRHLLHPLFFGTLNRRHDDRSRFARAFGVIPFLNGGLFEPHAIERMHRMQLPADYWRDAFAALVDRVDVTLDADVEDGRVNPELLGRVFEGVMHPAERKDRGAFFTPPPLVSAMLREAVACHLAPKLGVSEERLEHALEDPDATLRRTLLDVTVLDPAVGSGAFLVGALDLLHGPGLRDRNRVRHLVTRRLFGVDRHPGAVRLCELRLWLEVLRSMRGRAPAQIPPLPNLDAQIRAGDALIDPLGTILVDRDGARRVALRQRAILGAHGVAKRAAIAEARRVERLAMLRAMREQEAVIDRDVAELLAAARAPTLFGDRPRLDAGIRRDIAQRRRQRAQLRAERRAIIRDAAAAPFALSAAFAPQLDRGGFDLVVGNPPWVRAERLPAVTRDALAARYRWWRSGTGAGWQHLPDLSVAFVERSFSLLAAGGTLALLVPSKLATAGYASACRAGLAQRSTIHRVADLGDDPRAGFDATTYPLAILASRRSAPNGHVIRLGLHHDDAAQPQASWQQATEWTTGSPDGQVIAIRLGRAHPRLGDFVRPQLGVKTGANVAFLNPPSKLREWSRPAVRGRDIRPFLTTSTATLLWAADARGIPWRTLPAAVRTYLSEHEALLNRRADQITGPWWQLFRTRAATAPHRVVWRDLARELQAATMHDTDAVPLNSCYVAAMQSAEAAESLTAWLNSSPIRALARLGAEPAAGGCARFAARTIGSLPLPREVLGHTTLSSFSRAAIDHDVQSELDDCVSDMLGLTTTERATLIDLATHRR